MDLYIERGKRIVAMRKAKKLTQVELARRSGLSQPTISDLETGKTQEVGASTLLRIAAVLETNPAYLMSGKGNPNDKTPAGSEAEVIALYAKLNESNQSAAMAVLISLLETQNK